MMWPTTHLPSPTTPFISTAKLPPQPPPITAHPRRRTHRTSATSDEVSGLGQAVFTALKSGPPQTKKSPGSKPIKKEEDKEGKEISGSDVLLALQKASARKAHLKKQQQKKVNQIKSSEDVNRVVDYDKVRPVVVKSDWATRLDDLRIRLQEFSTF